MNGGGPEKKGGSCFGERACYIHPHRRPHLSLPVHPLPLFNPRPQRHPHPSLRLPPHLHLLHHTHPHTHPHPSSDSSSPSPHFPHLFSASLLQSPVEDAIGADLEISTVCSSTVSSSTVCSSTVCSESFVLCKGKLSKFAGCQFLSLDVRRHNQCMLKRGPTSPHFSVVSSPSLEQSLAQNANGTDLEIAPCDPAPCVQAPCVQAPLFRNAGTTRRVFRHRVFKHRLFMYSGPTRCVFQHLCVQAQSTGSKKMAACARVPTTDR